MNDIILSTQNGEPVASSRDVAKRFGKEHRNVMRDIENLMSEGVLKIECMARWHIIPTFLP